MEDVKIIFKRMNAVLAANIDRAKRKGITYKAIAKESGVKYSRIQGARDIVFPFSDEERAAINKAITTLILRK